MKKTAALMVALGALLVTGAAEAKTTPACHVLDTATATGLFDKWDNALKSGDPDKVVVLYEDDAVLLPTLSNIPRHNHAEMREYFEHFLAKHPIGTIDQRNVKSGCNFAVDDGTYTFQVDDAEKGGRKDVQARYSFVYQWKNDKWLIAHHHSSLMPEKVAAPGN
jgi:uncharacterized protein (TIGR02246 family)